MFDPEKIRPVKETRHKGHPLYDSAHIKRPKETQTDTAGSGTAHIRAPSSVVGGRPALAGRGAAPLLSPPRPPTHTPLDASSTVPASCWDNQKCPQAQPHVTWGASHRQPRTPSFLLSWNLPGVSARTLLSTHRRGHLAQPPPGALPVPRGRALTCPEHPRPRAGRQRVSG